MPPKLSQGLLKLSQGPPILRAVPPREVKEAVPPREVKEAVPPREIKETAPPREVKEAMQVGTPVPTFTGVQPSSIPVISNIPPEYSYNSYRDYNVKKIISYLEGNSQIFSQPNNEATYAILLNKVINYNNIILKANRYFNRTLPQYLLVGINRGINDTGNIANIIRNNAIDLYHILMTNLTLNVVFMRSEYKDFFLGGIPAINNISTSLIRLINFIQFGLDSLDNDVRYFYYRDGYINNVLQYNLGRPEGLINGNFYAYIDLFNEKLLNYQNEAEYLWELFITAITPYVRPNMKIINEDPELKAEYEAKGQIILPKEALYTSLTVKATVFVESEEDEEGGIKTIKETQIRHFPLNPEGINRLHRYSINPELEPRDIQIDSDYWSTKYYTVTHLELLEHKNYISGWTPQANKNIGNFPFLSNFNCDLTPIQILREEDIKNYVGENCVIWALRQSGVHEDKLQEIREAFPEGSHMDCKYLENIATEVLKEPIKLSYFDKNQIRHTIYNKQKGVIPAINLAKYYNHIFINQKYYNCTTYYVNNYETLKDNPRAIMMSRAGRYDNPKYYDTLHLVKELDEKKLFVESPLLLNIPGRESKQSDNDEILLTEDSIIDNQREYTFKPKNNKKQSKRGPYSLWASDFEADTTGVHRPLLSGAVHITDKKQCVYYKFNTGNVVTNLLNRIYSQTKCTGKRWAIVYYHNLKYDIELMLNDIDITADLSKDNNVYYVGIRYFGMYIEFRDFAKIVPAKLNTFGKMFDLPKQYRKQEAIAYNYYKLENRPDNLNNLNKTIYVSYNEYASYLTDKERPILLNNLEEHRILFKYGSTHFNPWIYYEYYLKYDCLVLALGIIKMMEELNELNINMLNFNTLGSISIYYAKMHGAFDGICQVKGSLRKFIHKAINGGRNHVNTFYQKKLIDANVIDKNKNKIYPDPTTYEGVTDLDANSLYPSAMTRICNENGFPLGYCKWIKTFEPEKYCDYVVEIQILSIDRKQQMPMICERGKDGILNYINDIPKESFIVTVDKTTLEDYIYFHDIKYKFIKGVYWDQGYNDKLGKVVINTLYNLRLNAKSEAKKSIYKLMMNAIYGKTIPKLIHIISEVVPKIKWRKQDNGKWFGDKNNCQKYIYTHYNTISEWMDLGDKSIYVKRYCYDNSYNFAHIGCKILSMSRRIMNEVFDIANTHDIPIFYTDTDSMQLLKSHLPELSKFYYEAYDNDLMGDNLMQFKVDFKIDNCSIKANNIISPSAIFIDKKVYLNNLQAYYDDEHIINSVHVRFKGIRYESIMHLVNKDYGGNLTSLFVDIAKDTRNKIRFDMTAGGTVANFTNKLYQYVRTDKITYRSI